MSVEPLVLTDGGRDIDVDNFEADAYHPGSRPIKVQDTVMIRDFQIRKDAHRQKIIKVLPGSLTVIKS